MKGKIHYSIILILKINFYNETNFKLISIYSMKATLRGTNNGVKIHE